MATTHWMYGLVILYPFIGVVLSRLLGASGSWLAQIKGEFLLFLGILIIWFAVILFLLLPKAHISPLVDFICFTLFYFVVSVLRKTVFTGSGEPVVKAVDKLNV